MSFGFSPTDIVTAIGACKWLIDHGFSKQNAADVLYKQFESAIRNLEHTLSALHQALQNASAPDDLIDEDPNASEKHTLLNECGELVGDFGATIKECRSLLEENRDLFQWKNNFVVNVRYNISIRGQVEDLQRRLQFHTGKLSLVLEPVRLQVLIRIEARIVEMQERLWPTPDLDGSRLTPGLMKCFEASFPQGAPSDFTNFDTLSRRDGIDALYRQWRESTIQAEDRSQNIPRYLNLLKAHYLVIKLKEARPYKTAIRGYPYQRAILQLQKRIAGQYERLELSLYVEEELVGMPSEYFSFWVNPNAHTASTFDDETFLEDTLLHIELPELPQYSRHSLILKRMSSTNFRLILEKVPLGSIAPNRESERVNMHSDRLIPWYATSTSRHVRYDLEIQNGNGAGRKLYVLNGTRDVFALQRALTGYQVASDTAKVSWTINEEKLKIWSSLSGSKAARLQLWLWNPPSESDGEFLGSSEMRGTPVKSRSVHTASGTNFSVSSTGTLAKIIEGCDPSSFSILESPAGNGQDRADAVIAAASLGLPVLMVYTKMQGRYTYLALELDNDIVIDPSKCRCADNTNTCKKVVIKQRSNHSFRLRLLATDPEDIDTWDLSIFGRPAQFGLERHPLYNSDKIKKLSIKFLSLGFEDPEARARFVTHFRMASNHRDDQEHKVKKVYERFRSAFTDPKQTGSSERIVSNSPRAQSSVSTVASSAPRLSSISIPNSLLRSDTLGTFMDEKASPAESMEASNK